MLSGNAPEWIEASNLLRGESRIRVLLEQIQAFFPELEVGAREATRVWRIREDLWVSLLSISH